MNFYYKNTTKRVNIQFTIYVLSIQLDKMYKTWL